MSAANLLLNVPNWVWWLIGVVAAIALITVIVILIIIDVNICFLSAFSSVTFAGFVTLRFFSPETADSDSFCLFSVVSAFLPPLPKSSPYLLLLTSIIISITITVISAIGGKEKRTQPSAERRQGLSHFQAQGRRNVADKGRRRRKSHQTL